MLRAIDFHGLKGVEFSKGEYTALLIPEMGANLVRLANTRLGAEILRTPGPGEIETFRSRPQVFGLPILFPPNRIADGRYVFEGRTYQYPITIERERNYHHGVLKSEAFLVSKARETDREVMIECRYYANAGNDAVYRDFPHEFKCKITYRLTAEGLEQEVVFFNRIRTLALNDPRYALAVSRTFAIPNGGGRSKRTAGRLKAEGVKPGVPDVALSMPSLTFHGLFIEMKSLTGQPSREQREFIAQSIQLGYCAAVARGAGEAFALWKAYVDGTL